MWIIGSKKFRREISKKKMKKFKEKRFHNWGYLLW